MNAAADRTATRTGERTTLVALALLFAVVYGTTAKGLALEWASSPDASYGAILAVVAFGLAWRRRHLVRAAATTASGSRPGLALLAAGLLLYLVGTLGADIFLTRFSLVVTLAGSIWFVAGRSAARTLAAPLCFLALAVPLPALVVNTITLPLQLVASQLAEGMLSLARVPVFRDGNILELRSTSLEVAEACSGLRSLISLGAIGCLIAWATERALWRRLAIIAAAVPVAIAFNGLRIAFTGIACETWGRHMARGGWHEFSGWVTFVVAVYALVLFQRLLPRRRSPQSGLAPEMVSA